MGFVVGVGSCAVPPVGWRKKSTALPGNGAMVAAGGFEKRNGRRLRIGASSLFCNPTDDPILKEVLKEPVAFLGGVFAGLLRLDLNEDPLKEWVTRTVEASGIKDDEEGGREGADADADADGDEQAPQQILIE